MTRGVEDAIETMRPGMAGIEFDTSVYRPASYIEESIDNVTLALIVGAVLAVLLLGAFFFRVRTALISIVAIPVSLVVAVLVLHAFGVTFNAIVLAGLAAALLLVIDDAVVRRGATSRVACAGRKGRTGRAGRRLPPSSPPRSRCGAPRSTRPS